jgi:Icc-related predicted phosphoesterase
LKFVTISDTHGQHSRLTLPEGDVLIHAGDVSRMGKEGQVLDFIQWFGQQPFEHKIFIAGNHDFYFEKMPDDVIGKIIPKNVVYLNDSSVTINGIKIWGSPISPWFYDWAFNRYRGADIRRHWDLIEPDTDILVTHGPVYNILDRTTRGEHVGCEDLLHTVNTIKPKVHICGHIHEAYGRREVGGTTFINASVLDENYTLVNEAMVFEI